MDKQHPNHNDYQIKIYDRIADIPAIDWDYCAGQQNPFILHAFIDALEESGDVSPRTGYWPHHLALYNCANELIAVVPTYIKDNSDAEVGSDLGWNIAHDRMCGPYYPKLQVEIPFSPVPGPRFLISPDINKNDVYPILLAHLKQIVVKKGLSSLHLNFINDEEKQFFEESGLLINMGTQFEWSARTQKSFDEFLSSLKPTKRQMIRRERKLLAKEDLYISTLTDESITETLMEQLFVMYKDTYERYESKSFLSQKFFQIIQKTMPKSLVLIAAHKEGKFIAGTLSFVGSDRLFVQHWGYREHIKFLHFELSYYLGMNYCFEHNLSALYAGPGGNHKANRGVLPLSTYHAHWFQNAPFGAAIGIGINKKVSEIKKQQNILNASSPYMGGL